MKWKGSLTNKRVNMAIDEITSGMKETLPKYKRLENGMYCEFENRYLKEKELTKLLKFKVKNKIK